MSNVAKVIQVKDYAEMARKKIRIKWPFKIMQVGESFVVRPWHSECHYELIQWQIKVASAAQYYRKALLQEDQMEFATRTVKGEGVIVTRVA